MFELSVTRFFVLFGAKMLDGVGFQPARRNNQVFAEKVQPTIGVTRRRDRNRQEDAIINRLTPD